MKIIDLLNKIANGEEDDLITEFEFDGKIWNFYKLNRSEYCLDGWLLNQDISITKHKEVLEEEKKIPEKLPDIRFDNGKFYLPINDKQMYILREIDKVFLDKINSIIDYLKSKGE